MSRRTFKEYKASARKKIHPFFPMYYIFDDGRIQNTSPLKYSPKHRKNIINPNFLRFKIFRKHPKWGHLFCTMVHADGKQRTIYPHKIIAELFVPNPKKKLHVIHINNNKNNNYYGNLRWVSQGDLNYIQYEQGKRNPVKEAKRMRKNGGIKDFTKSEIKQLFYLRDKLKLDWKTIAKKMKGRSIGGCQVKYSTFKKSKLTVK